MTLLRELPQRAHIHLMGICGTAMASLAGILKNMGFHVTGSDQNVYPPMSTQLQALGIEIQLGYRRENLVPRPDLVIVGNVITKKMEEAQALLESDIPYTSLPKALGEIVIADRKSIVVSGTHGKTTTTALMSWVTQQLGLRPGFLVGGIPTNFGKSFQNPEGDIFVIEGDEYDTAFFDKVPKFTHYKACYAILTSVEFDHADIYKDLSEVKNAFRVLLDQMPSHGFLVAHGDDFNIDDLLSQSPRCKVIRYGERKGNWTIGEVEILPEYCEFEVLHREGEIYRRHDVIRTQLFGRYNLSNVLAVYCVAHQLGWNMERVKESIATFTGVKRRQEIIGKPRNITVIEDFAHHPTAVKVTLEGICERYQGRRVFAVFEPRSATSRRRVFQKSYVEAFDPADEIILCQTINSDALPEADRFSVKELVDDLKVKGKRALALPDVDAIVQHLQEKAQSSDVIIIMSNGAFGGIYTKILKALN